MSHGYENEENSRPAQFLVDNIELLPRGKALDIAMGSGRNAIYLANNGFEVEGIDISEDAINAARRLAKENMVNLRAELADLEKDYQIKPSFYDVIVCFNYLQPSLIPQMKAGLKSAGMIVYETFIIDQPKFGKPRNPDFLLEHNELLNMFRDFRCLRYREGIIENRKAIASLVAQRIQ
jgi:tellurite methyltransferase